VSAISETMAAAGLLAALLLLDHCAGVRPGLRAWALAIAAGLVLLAGLLSKEVIITVVPVLGLWLWRGRRVALRLHLPLYAAILAFLALRINALGGLEATGATGAQRLQALQNLPVLLLDGLRALLLLAPVGPRHLSYDYQGLHWSWSVAATTVLAAILAAAWVGRRRQPLLLLGLVSFVALLAPVALVTTVPGWGGFARYLYTPWLLLATAAAALVRQAWRWLAVHRPGLQPVVLLLLLGYLAAQLVGQQHALVVYSSQEALARASIRIAPQVPEGYEWLGNVALQRGDLETALHFYQAAVERGPTLYNPRHNVAACQLHLGRPREALAQLRLLEQQHGVTVGSCVLTVETLLLLRQPRAAAARLQWMLQRAPGNQELEALRERLCQRYPELATQ
jgi:tetratricopeptide (TPR) repeat protein